MKLTTEEGRVLGALVEKQLTTPQLYPLTENALIAACNQTTNRDPVVSYGVWTIRVAARGLREKGLVRLVHHVGERIDKHQHVFDKLLDLPPEQVSLLTALLLRGPQTLAELRVRCDRMHPFDNLAAVQQALDALTYRDVPLVRSLERQPGRREARYGQLLVHAEQTDTSPRSEQKAPPDSLTLVDLVREVSLLRREMAELRRQVERHREGQAGR